MLDQTTVAVIKSTIPLLESAGPALTQHFYQRMFSHNPELKDIFNLAHQRSGGQPLARSMQSPRMQRISTIWERSPVRSSGLRTNIPDS